MQGKDTHQTEQNLTFSDNEKNIVNPNNLQNFDLIDLYNLLYSRKLVILFFSVLMTISGAVYIYFSTPYFLSNIIFITPPRSLMSGKSSTTNVLGGVSDILGVGEKSSPQTSYALSVLKSREFLAQFFNRYNVLPYLLPKYWNTQTKSWKTMNISFPGKVKDFFLGEEPDFIKSDEEKRNERAYKIFSKIMSININKDTHIITLSIEWTNPIIASRWANQLLEMLNQTLRARTIMTSQKRVKYLQKEIKNTNIAKVRHILYSIMENEIQTSMIANVQKDFSFSIIDKAYPASRPFKPRKIVILTLSMIGGFLMISLYIMAKNYIVQLRRMKKQPTQS